MFLKLYPVIKVWPKAKLVLGADLTGPVVVPLVENIFMIGQVLEVNKKLLHKALIIHAVGKLKIKPEISFCFFFKRTFIIINSPSGSFRCSFINRRKTFTFGNSELKLYSNCMGAAYQVEGNAQGLKLSVDFLLQPVSVL